MGQAMISATVKEEAIIQNCRYQQISPNTINYFKDFLHFLKSFTHFGFPIIVKHF